MVETETQSKHWYKLLSQNEFKLVSDYITTRINIINNEIDEYGDKPSLDSAFKLQALHASRRELQRLLKYFNFQLEDYIRQSQKEK